MIPILALAATMSQLNPPKLQAKPFPAAAIRITSGPFEHAHGMTAKYLLELDTNRLLAGFRANAGLKTSAAIYGGWETGGLSGHSVGHYLTACSQEFARTKDKRFKQKVDAIVKGLKECQNARKDGFICAFRFEKGFDPKRLDDIWDDVSKGKLKSGGFDLNGMWSPWYVHHKLFAGLLDAQSMCDNKEALGVAKQFGNWAYNITKDLSPEQWQTMLGTEWGGMNESLAELYVRTKDARYLELSRKFNDKRVLEPLSKGEDNLSGKHSNTQIPKIIGLARLYEINGSSLDRKTAEFFWDRVVNHHSYAIGGNSNGEYLGPADKLNDRLSSNTCETCNTYNMLKLTRMLFSWSPNSKLMDYYERAYINHILASQDPSSGMVTYFMPLGTGTQRNFSNKFDDFTCCHGSGMENHTKHGDTAFFKSGSAALWVNLFMPSELDWHEAGVKVTQSTNFPFDGSVSLKISSAAAKQFDLRIRRPEWASGPLVFKVNGKPLSAKDREDGYASLNRTWSNGDTVSFELPMNLHTEPMPDNPRRVAMMYGPVVLAAAIPSDENSLVAKTPVIVSEKSDVKEWLTPVYGKPLTFRTLDSGKPYPLEFSPFFSMHDRRLGVYFDVFSPQDWTKIEAQYRAEEDRIRDLESRTIDKMVIGEMQPERDHNLTSERNDVREANGRSFRTPMNDGWFEFDLKCDAATATELVMTYWGNDLGKPVGDVFVEGVKIGTTDFGTQPKNRFFDLTYAVPAELTKGKAKIRVKIAATAGQRGPSVSGARLLRSAITKVD